MSSPIFNFLKEIKLQVFLPRTGGLIYLAILCIVFARCKKLVTIPEPVNTITTSETFSTVANANSALIGIYNDISIGYNGGNFDFGNGFITVNCGLSSDELNYFIQDPPTLQFQYNSLQAINPYVNGYLWYPIYFDIYLANTAVEGLQASTGISDSLRKQLTGEAKFLRAFCYFYATNLFGDIPLPLASDWNKTETLTRSSQNLIYNQIKVDLVDAASLLATDYSVSGGERIRANKWAATALLARTNLYIKDWPNAEAQATLVINNSAQYSLDTLNGVFLANSSEAILQLQTNTSFTQYATLEGNAIIPPLSKQPSYYCTPQLLASFEPGDRRMLDWIDSTIYAGTTYYYPFKYKVRVGTAGNTVEYYMLLRLAEQFLIRAEARAQQNNTLGAIADLNVIRERAGLADLPTTLDQPQTLAAVAQERRIELFAEWGHRWLDLKRTNMASQVLKPIKIQWTSTAQLYPIPESEIQINPRLSQNAGY
ncbi:MAG TPA: RagB/SusD family nutrient uptake outer membrane protein [Puia sp.]|nr:RagB/SusD family nutrient uptake outer membrane protein [Puia sp.]